MIGYEQIDFCRRCVIQGDLLSTAEVRALCRQAEVAILLRDAAKQAIWRFTGEYEEQWRKSQKYKEAPYHFLYEAITQLEAIK